MDSECMLPKHSGGFDPNVVRTHQNSAMQNETERRGWFFCVTESKEDFHIMLTSDID